MEKIYSTRDRDDDSCKADIEGNTGMIDGKHHLTGTLLYGENSIRRKSALFGRKDPTRTCYRERISQDSTVEESTSVDWAEGMG